MGHTLTEAGEVGFYDIQWKDGIVEEHIPAGAMIGMGIGFILQQLYSKSSN